MSKKTSMPDAWDDDWETQADKQDELINPSTRPSKAERLAKHAEHNKKLWDSAESTTEENFHFLASRTEVPLKTTFKPAVKVLSRKPAPKPKPTADPGSAAAGSISQLAIVDYEDDDDDDEDRHGQNNALTPEERKRKAQLEREEKQRRYDEVRERLFGSNHRSGNSTPGDVTPPPRARSAGGGGGAAGEDDGGGNRRVSRGRGKGGNNRDNASRRLESSASPAYGSDSRSSRTRMSSDQGGKKKQLYDPGYNVKPESVSVRKRDVPEGSAAAPRTSQAASLEEGQLLPIRTPRGPDGSGKMGSGFSGRGRGGS